MLRRLMVLTTLLLGASAAALAAGGGTIAPEEVLEMLESGERFLLVDVRTQQHFGLGHIEGALNMPAFVLKHRRLPTDVPIVIYDDGAGSAAVDEAAAELDAAGTRYKILEGGYVRWQILEQPTAEQRGLLREPLVPPISPEHLQRLIDDPNSGVLVVDVRGTQKSASTGWIPGALQLQLARAEDVARRMPKGSRERLVVIYDDGDGSGEKAAEQLRREGYRAIRVLHGGFRYWTEKGLEVAR